LPYSTRRAFLNQRGTGGRCGQGCEQASVSKSADKIPWPPMPVIVSTFIARKPTITDPEIAGLRSAAASTRPEADSRSLALKRFGKPALFSAILLHILAVRPVHEYNITMGGNKPQVTVLSQLAMSNQRHDGITCWYSSQVEGLVAFTGSAGSSPVSGTLPRDEFIRGPPVTVDAAMPGPTPRGGRRRGG
jgi:hypothetical protein